MRLQGRLTAAFALALLMGCSGTMPDGSGGEGEISMGLASADGKLTATLSLSEWGGGSGYCANIHLANSGSSTTSTWTVVVNLNGSTVTNSWSAQFSNSGGLLTATPLSWNAALAPGASTDFGFCATVTTTARASLQSVTGSGSGQGTGGATGTGGGTSTGGTPSTGGTMSTGGVTSTGGTGAGGTGGTCASATYEGETMTASATGIGQPQGTFFNLWSNGSISTTASFSGSNTVTVYAAGTAADSSHNPHMVVEVNGAAIGNATVTPGTTFNAYKFNTTASGSQKLAVRFDNDFLNSTTGADTNLYVDKVVVSCGTSGTGGTGGTAGTGGSGGTGGSATGGGGGTGGSATGGTGGSGGTTGKKFVGNITTNGQVRSDFATYWNQITPENEGKWGSVEATRNVMNWSGLDRAHDYAKQHGFPFKEHNLVWGSQQPSWLSGLSQSDQRAEVEQWIQLFCQRYPDTQLIDVVNEPPPHTTPVYTAALGGAGTSGYDWIVQAFKWAHQYCPNAILILNDYNNIEYSTDNAHFVDIVNRIKAAGAPITGIGAQAHAAYSLSTSTVQGFLQKLEATGVPVYITEYDINLADDTQQKNVMQSQFTMFYNDPNIRGITLWGYIVGATWEANTGLMTSTGTMRPAMSWLMSFLGR